MLNFFHIFSLENPRKRIGINADSREELEGILKSIKLNNRIVLEIQKDMADNTFDSKWGVTFADVTKLPLKEWAY